MAYPLPIQRELALPGADHSPGARAHQAQNNPAPPLDASPKRCLTFTSDGPDTPLQWPPVGLKSFDDGQFVIAFT